VYREVRQGLLASHRDARRSSEVLCAGYERFVEYIDEPMTLMADLLRQDGFADEAMAILSARD